MIRCPGVPGTFCLDDEFCWGGRGCRAVVERHYELACVEHRAHLLRAALKPFAEIAANHRRRSSNLDHSTLVHATLGACLRAEAALMDATPEEGP